MAQLRKAAELETLAVQEKQQATEQLAGRREQVADEREETERWAEQRKHEFERQAEIHERKVEKKAAKKAAAAREVKAVHDKAITRDERTAKAKASGRSPGR